MTQQTHLPNGCLISTARRRLADYDVRRHGGYKNQVIAAREAVKFSTGMGVRDLRKWLAENADVYYPQVGDDVLVNGRAYLPHIGVEVQVPDGGRDGHRFSVTDISTDNYGTAISLEHVAGLTNLYVTPEDIEAGRTTLTKLVVA